MPLACFNFSMANNACKYTNRAQVCSARPRKHETQEGCLPPVKQWTILSQLPKQVAGYVVPCLDLLVVCC